MAPALEEELVAQIVGNGEEHDREYITDRVRLLREQGFPVNERAVETALERLNLIKRYHSQNVKPREVRRAQREILLQIGREKIEELKKDPSVVSARFDIEGGYNYKCYLCGTGARAAFRIRYIRLLEVTDKLIIKKGRNSLDEGYCFACKKISKY